MHMEVDFYFDYGSPSSYLAYQRLPAIAERMGARVNYRPILLGGVLKAIGNMAPGDVPAKGAWLFADLSRWARRYGVPFQQNPFFPINTLHLMRGAIAMRRAGRLLEYSDAVYKAIWADGENFGDPKVISTVLGSAGFDVPALFAACDDPSVKAELKADTDSAVARGVFGAPTFFVDGEQHFGQDRLDFVEEALNHTRATA